MIRKRGADGGKERMEEIKRKDIVHPPTLDSLQLLYSSPFKFHFGNPPSEVAAASAGNKRTNK